MKDFFRKKKKRFLLKYILIYRKLCFTKNLMRDSSFRESCRQLRDNFPVDSKAGSYFSSQDKASTGLLVSLRAPLSMVA